MAAAAAVGVERIVYLSFVSPAPDATFILAREHFHTEEYIRSTGLAFTFLRQSLYMDKVAQHVARSDVIRVPAGEGRVAWVSRDDVADSAIGVLTGTGHDGQAYDITGPEALTMAETAERLTAALGRNITYEAQTPHEARTARNTSRMEEMEAARKARTGQGLTDQEVEIWISHYLQIATGEAAKVSDAVPMLCGRPAESLAEYLGKHLAELTGRRPASRRMSLFFGGGELENGVGRDTLDGERVSVDLVCPRGFQIRQIGGFLVHDHLLARHRGAGDSPRRSSSTRPPCRRRSTG